jgi:putative mRNA 3-end processing factor
MNRSQHRFRNVLECTARGLYCPAGDFYIDPWRAVDCAVITHAHSDHARWGSKAYLAAEPGRELLRWRLGEEIALETLRYGETRSIGSARVSLYPAGHILGSAQVRIEVDGVVAVVTGDYKRQRDATCTPWEPVPCHLYVTESTFALPVFRWPSIQTIIEEIENWWLGNQADHRTSVLLAYAVGKSQRLIAELCRRMGNDGASEILVHGALIGPNHAYRMSGVAIPELESASSQARNHDWSKALVIAPPSAQNSPWLSRFKNPSLAMASGWMGIRGTRRRRALDRGFVLSDHADWEELQASIEECQPEAVWATHGFAETMARYQSELGRDARAIETRFTGDSEQVDEEAGGDPIATSFAEDGTE